jgi:RNA-directed DNA polymerase
MESQVPKTFKHLYPQIYSFEALYRAYRQARRGGKRKHQAVAAFECHLEEGLWDLHAELQDKTYRPGPYRSFAVGPWRRDRLWAPKRRLISAAPFRDRVVHHALCNVLVPIFEPRFISDSYACREGKGTHAAVDRCQEFARRCRYVLQCDVRQFFPSVDHQLLRGMLARHVADPDVLWLIDLILEGSTGLLAGEYEMAWFPGDALWDALRPRGLPIGNLTSQFWANVYLNSVDQFIKQELRCRRYVRYCDDFLLFHEDKATLHAWRAAVIAHAATLRLMLHEEKAVVYPTHTGIPFLGFRVFPHYRRLLHPKVHAFARRLRRLRAGYAAGELSAEAVRLSVQGWLAHATHAQTYRLRRRLLGEVSFAGGVAPSGRPVLTKSRWM